MAAKKTTFLVYNILRENFQALILLAISLILFWQLLLVPFVEDKQLVSAAQNFLQRRLYFTDFSQAPMYDVASYKEKLYPYLGPFPAVALMPLVALSGAGFPEHVLTIFFGLLSFWAVFKIGQKFGLSTNDALLLTIGFHFGSVFLFTWVVKIATLEVQTIATSLLSLALYEFFYQKRWLVIGIILGAAIATRLTLLGSLLFFSLEIFLDKKEASDRLKSFSLFFLPIILTLFGLFLYNLFRFDNGFESGYKYSISLPATPNYQAAERYGIFSPKHMLTNVYFFLFKGPDLLSHNQQNLTLEAPFFKTDQMGMGILFTSPIFIYLLLLDWRRQYVLTSMLTSALIFWPSLLYFGIGHSQFGYRYALDFYPFLLLMLLTIFAKPGLPNFAKVLIVYSVLFNSYFLYSIWGIYPFFK